MPDEAPEWKSLFARIYHEKRADSFLIQATNGAGRRPLPSARALLDNAEAEYSRALTYTRRQRDALNVRGHLALVRYLQSASEKVDVAAEMRQAATEETRQIRSSAKTVGCRDVEEWAATNVRVMERGGLEGWTPYEVL